MESEQGLEVLTQCALKWTILEIRVVFSGLALAVTVWCQGLKWQLEINTLEFLWLLQSNFLECFQEKKNLNKKKIDAIPICVQAVLDVDLIGPECQQAEYAVLDVVD